MRILLNLTGNWHVREKEKIRRGLEQTTLNGIDAVGELPCDQGAQKVLPAPLQLYGPCSTTGKGKHAEHQA